MKYYNLAVKDDNAVLNIYGDIVSYKAVDRDVTAYDIVKELKGITAKKLDVYINSYGGEVAEGLAIFNALKRSKAKVTTYVDGFACSIASVIAMAGERRVMYPTSLMMIHNAWTFAAGNADEMRKVADDLDIITSASINAYMSNINISEAELKELLDNETWLTAEEALEKGFITEVQEAPKASKHSQSARNSLFKMFTELDNPNPEEPENEPTEPENEPEDEGGVEAKIDELLEKVDSIIKKLSDKENEGEEQPEEQPEEPEEALDEEEEEENPEPEEGDTGDEKAKDEEEEEEEEKPVDILARLAKVLHN